MSRSPTRNLTTLALLGVAWPAWAQAPEGLMKHDAASSGKTDVATSGFEAATKAPDEPPDDATELSLSAGGLVAAGNTRSLALTSAGNFKLRRGMNQLSSALAANFARSAPNRDEPLAATAENIQGKLRYDRFLSRHVAVFLGTSVRHDRFQGLDLRFNVDPGVAYYFVDADKHQLWTEVGYDFQYDVRRDENIAGTDLDKTEVRHSGRLFVGYENKLNEAVAFTTGIEYIQSVQETKSFRLNYDAGLTSTLAGRLAAATTFGVRYDNNPLPDIEKTDLVTAMSLVFTFL
jgi:putative salt-induced outer membrane protein